MPSNWHIPSNARIWLGGHNTELRALAEKLVFENPRPPTGPIDAGIITPSASDEAAYFAEKLRARFSPPSTLWIVVTPKADIKPFERALSEIGFYHRESIELSPEAIAMKFTLTCN